MKKIIVITLLMGMMYVAGFSQEYHAGCFVYTGDEESTAQIKKTLVFFLLRDMGIAGQMTEYTAWYFAYYYSDSILTCDISDLLDNREGNNDGYISIGNNVNLIKGMIDGKTVDINKILQDECFTNSFNLDADLANWKNIKETINKSITGTKVNYKIRTDYVNIDIIPEKKKAIDGWLDNIQFGFFSDIDNTKIQIENNSTNPKIPDEEIKNYFTDHITNGDVPAQMQEIFTEKQLSAPAGNHSDPGGMCYDLAAMGSKMHKEAYTASSDYFLLLIVDYINLEYCNGDKGFFWKITSSDLSIKLYNTASNEALATMSFEIRDLKANTVGDNSYKSLRTQLLNYVKQIVTIENFSMGTSIAENSNNFFTQLYSNFNLVFNPIIGGKNNTTGFPFRIYVPEENNLNSDEITNILKNLESNSEYNFEIVEVRNGVNNEIPYVRAELKNCRFDVHDFAQDFKIRVKTLTGIDYENCDNAPSSFIVLFENVATYTFVDTALVNINLKAVCSDLKIDNLKVTKIKQSRRSWTGDKIYQDLDVYNGILGVGLYDADGKDEKFDIDKPYEITIMDSDNKICTIRNVRRRK